MTDTLTRDQMDLIDTCTDHNNVILRHAYSGRSMHGRTCIGFVFHDVADLIGTIVDIAIDDSDLARRMAAGSATDSMGLGTIVYFPRLASPDTDDEEEDL